ncbi:Glycosyltransferase involved in cell wall bisynthesis [bacterium A37T11]|nr:Glycosyltransferase involved in cell wall bisynthesis [bacterium A37T11]
MEPLRLCIIKPNKSAYSETFIQTHIELLQAEKYVLYGGDFPVYGPGHKFLIRNWVGLASYLVQKRFLKRTQIAVRNRALVNFLTFHRIQVVLAEYGTVGATIASACQSAGVPIVIHFHGADAHHQGTLKRFSSRYKSAFDYAKAMVVVSNDMLAQLVALGASPDKIKLIPYGVNIDLFKQVVIGNNQNFLNIGRMVEKKAPLLTISAFKEVVSQFPDAHLYIVGDGRLRKIAEQKVKEWGLGPLVTFTGVLKRKDILELMARSCCYVQHSVTASDGDMEGTPNTILEASAAGLPIVSTRHAGIKEAVIDGVTGYLVDEYDVAGMAEGMKKVLASREKAIQMGKAGREYMAGHYDVKKQILKLDTVLREAAGL